MSNSFFAVAKTLPSDLLPLAPTGNPGEDEACTPSFVHVPLDRERAEGLANWLRALADPARLQLLSILRTAPNREACVCDLVEPLGLSQPTVSHHLKVLLGAGLVQRERRGSWAYYKLNFEKADLLDLLVA